MTKGYELFKFFNFCILIKNKYTNSVILGSTNEISNKISLSYYLTNKYLKQGLKNGLLVKIDKGYKVAKYDDLIKSLNLQGKIQNYSFYKDGTLQELIIKNSFIIALYNFKAQQFKAEQKSKILSIRKRIATGQRVNKKQYQQSKKECANFMNQIVTGQKHLKKILGFSQQTCYQLLKIWDKVGFITRKVVFSNKIDPFYDNYTLNMNKGKMVVLGSKITLNSLVVTEI